jgi:hypothetical protein
MRSSAEEPPAQLMEFYVALCDELRKASGREPQFCLSNQITGDIVYELAKDLTARWPLLGGNGGKPGQAILVLTARSADKRGSHVEQPGVPAPNVKYVDLDYPAESGLKSRLEAEGWDVTWRRDDRPRNDEAVPVTDEQYGMEYVYKLRGPDTDQTLYKKRRS